MSYTPLRLLFKIDLTKSEASKLSTALRHANKQTPGKQDELNKCLDDLYVKYGHEDPESCHLVIVGQTLYVNDYPTLEEMALPPQPAEQYAKNWEDFWKEICLNEDGSVNLDQIKRELSDFHGMMKEVSEVYDTLTGGAISKPNTLASVVIAEVQRIQQEELDELEEELTGDAGQEGGQQG